MADSTNTPWLTKNESFGAQVGGGAAQGLGSALTAQSALDANQAGSAAYAAQMGPAYQQVGANALANQNAQVANYAPTLSAGNTAAGAYGSQLSNQLGNDVPQFNMNSAGTIQDYMNPALGFQVQQGTRALDQSAAAKGGLYSTGHANDVQSMGQGLGQTAYQNAYQQYTGQQSQAYQAYTNSLNQQLARQQSRNNFITSGMGASLNAAAGTNQSLEQGFSNQSAAKLGAANVQGQADASAASNPGFFSMNTLGSALTGLGSTASGLGAAATKAYGG